MARFKNPADIKVRCIGYRGAFNTGKVHLDEMATAGMTLTAVGENDPARPGVAAVDFSGIEPCASVAGMPCAPSTLTWTWTSCFDSIRKLRLLSHIFRNA